MAVGTFGAEEIILKLLRGNRILDVGCGYGKYGWLARIYLRASSVKPYIIGIDIGHESLNMIKGIYDDVILADARFPPFRNGCFHSSILAEVIEHLPRQEGYRVIEKLYQASQRVIVSTPARRVFRYSKGHITLWRSSDLKKMGFKTYGVRCYPKLATESYLLQFIITFILWPISVYIPDLATFIVAFKERANRQ